MKVRTKAPRAYENLSVELVDYWYVDGEFWDWRGHWQSLGRRRKVAIPDEYQQQVMALLLVLQNIEPTAANHCPPHIVPGLGYGVRSETAKAIYFSLLQPPEKT